MRFFVVVDSLIIPKMCDCPTAGVFTSHEAYRSWIMFKECKTENGTKIEAGSQRTRTSSTHSTHTNQDISSLLLESLDPHLRPGTPDFSLPKSVALFEEHQQLAQEYWKMQTEMVMVAQKKNQLLAAEAEDQQRQMNLKALQEEKESLILARDLLLQQKERSSLPGNSSRNSGDGWVIVPRHGER